MYVMLGKEVNVPEAVTVVLTTSRVEEVSIFILREYWLCSEVISTTAIGGSDDRRGSYDDRRGGYDDRRGGYDDRRGGGRDYDRRYDEKLVKYIPIISFIFNWNHWSNLRCVFAETAMMIDVVEEVAETVTETMIVVTETMIVAIVQEAEIEEEEETGTKFGLWTC